MTTTQQVRPERCERAARVVFEHEHSSLSSADGLVTAPSIRVAREVQGRN
jgi:hypothetical protein